MLKVSLVALLMAAAAPIVAAQDREIPRNNLEIVIRGDYFRAAMVAYEDFSKLLAERAERARVFSDKGDKAFGDNLAIIDNYAFHVGKGPGHYVVWITPRMSQEMPGVLGGGATYTIDAKTFIVSTKQYSK